MANRAIEEVAVGVSVHSARSNTGWTEASQNTAFGCRFAQRKIRARNRRSREVDHLVQTEISERLARRSETIAGKRGSDNIVAARQSGKTEIAGSVGCCRSCLRAAQIQADAA